MSNKQDYQKYLQWAGQDTERIAPTNADTHRCPPPLAHILEHGMVVGGVCTLSNKLPGTSGLEFGVLSRTYVDPAKLATPMPGIKHIILPYPVEAGTPVLTIITGVGAGADALITTCRWLPAHYLSYLIPQHMEHDHWIALRPVVGSNETEFKLIHLGCPEREAGDPVALGQEF